MFEVIMKMISKYNEKNQSLSKKNIRIPDIIQSKSKPKSIHRDHSQSNDYGTDNKRSLHRSNAAQIQQLKSIMSSCNTCMNKISDFNTKKPNHKIDRSTQTTQKTFLVDLIQQKVQQICNQNHQLTKTLLDRQSDLTERNQQIVDMEDKFTNILYTLGQQYSQLKITSNDIFPLSQTIPYDSQTPSYIKALTFDR